MAAVAAGLTACLALSGPAVLAIAEHVPGVGLRRPALERSAHDARATHPAAQRDSRRPDGPGRGVPGAPEPRAWWRDAEMARELGLTSAQTMKLDRLYEQRQKQIQPTVDEYKRLKAELDQMFRDRSARADDVEAQARRLTYPQMEVVVSRVRLLYEMSRVITPEQNQKLQQIFEREHREQQERGRGRGPDGNLPHP